MRRARLATFFALTIPAVGFCFQFAELGPLVPAEFQLYGKIVAAAVPFAAGAVWLAVATVANLSAVRAIFPWAALTFYTLSLTLETGVTMMPNALMREPLVFTTAETWRHLPLLGMILVAQAGLAFLIVPVQNPSTGSEQ